VVSAFSVGQPDPTAQAEKPDKIIIINNEYIIYFLYTKVMICSVVGEKKTPLTRNVSEV